MFRRPPLIAVVAGLIAVVAVIGIVAVLGDDGEQVDGTFVLTEPGVFQEPLDEVNEDATGDALPDVSLVDADERPVDLSLYRGGPTVINLWFSTCVPCERELRDFAEVHGEYGDRVAFVGVNPFDTVDAMLRFADERGVTYDLLRDPDRILSLELGVIAYPVTLFVDADGNIVEQTGEIDADTLRSMLDRLFFDGA